MVNARHLVEETRHALQEVETRIRRHPYLDALDAGSLAREELRRFAGQQYHIIGSDLRAMALLIAKAESPETREFFWGGIQGEWSALDEEAAFFELFSSQPPGFHERALRVIQEGLDRGVTPENVRRAARLLQGYELLYWDTLYHAATA